MAFSGEGAKADRNDISRFGNFDDFSFSKDDATMQGCPLLEIEQAGGIAAAAGRCVDSAYDTAVLHTELPCSVLRRQQICWATSFCMLVVYIQRIAPAIAAEGGMPRSTVAGNSAAPGQGGEQIRTMLSEFGWSGWEQGVLFGSFFLGYMVFQLPSSYMMKRWGPKNVLVAGLLGSSVFTALTPIAADYSFSLAVACRIMTGLAQGPEFPAASQLVQSWAPPLERSQSISIMCSGALLGAFLGTPFFGMLLVCIGWRSIFYISGGLGVYTAVCYAHFAGDSPESDERVTADEVEFIRASKERAGESDEGQPDAKSHEDSQGTLIKQMLQSPAVWAQMLVGVGNNFSFYILLGEMPTFLHTVLGFSQRTIAIVSPLPYGLMWIVTLGAGCFADWLLSNAILEPLQVRRLCLAMASLPAAVLLLAAGYAPPSLALICLMLAVGFNGFYSAAVPANVVEVGGRHAGTLFALTNSFGQISGIVGAPLVGALTESMGYQEGFRLTFWMSFALQVCCVAFFFAASSSEVLSLGQDARPDSATSV